MSGAKLKRFASTHYLLMGYAVAGECFLDRDGNTTLRLAKGSSLSWLPQHRHAFRSNSSREKN
jgi:hypothetical protein